MCLKRILSKKKKKKIIDKIDGKGITVYKVVEAKEGKYYPPFLAFNHQCPYEDGLNEARSSKIYSIRSSKIYSIRGIQFMYNAGFHFFKTKAGAKRLKNRLGKYGSHKVVECTVKKSWITAIGTEQGYDKDGGWTAEDKEVIIVAKKAMFHFSGKKKD